MVNNFETEYKYLLHTILQNGIKRDDRTGIGSISMFSQSLEFDLSTGFFPLITGRKMFWKNCFHEFLWFLNGETNIKRFQENNVSIWDNWADKNGELGPVYGAQMLNFNNQGINQFEELIDSLTNNPDSRRHIITLWNPIQTKEMALPACYHNFQFFTDGLKLNVQIIMRSTDVFIGLPYDFGTLSLFLMYVSKLTKFIPGKIKFVMGDAHIYFNQFNQVNEYLVRPIYDLPKVIFKSLKEIELLNYKSGDHIKTPIAI